MEKNIVVILCKLERIFIPAFFDVMVHLVVHLATEAKLAGPVPFHWQYPFERYFQPHNVYIYMGYAWTFLKEMCVIGTCTQTY